MTARFTSPTPEQIARIRAEADRDLTPEEYRLRASIPISEQEREDALALIAWFVRRYPTPAARLRYAREAWSRWSRAMPRAATPRGE